MFKWFKKDPKSEAELKIEKIQQLLFPHPIKEMEQGMEFYVDESVDMNLDSVIYEIEDGVCDSTTVKTLKAISQKLFLARKTLQAYQQVDKNVKFVVTDIRDDSTE